MRSPRFSSPVRRRALAAALVALAAFVIARPASADLRSAFAADSARALALMDRGQIDSTRALLQPTIDAARAAGDRPMLARAQILLLGAEYQLGHVQPFAAQMRECANIAWATRDTSMLKRVLRQKAIAQFWVGDKAGAERTAAAIMDLAERTNDLFSKGEAHIILGDVLYLRGNSDAAIPHFEFALAAGDTVGNLRQQANALNWLANVCLQKGEWQKARGYLERERAIALRIPSQRYLQFATNNLGFVEVRMGDPALALHYFEDAAAMARQRHATADLLSNIDNIVEQQALLGRLDEAERNAREALSMALAEGLGEEVPWQKEALADVLWERHRREEAMQLYREVVAMGDSAALDPRAMSLRGLARAQAERDSVDAALATLAGLSPTAREQPGAEVLSQLHVLQLELLVRAGRAAEAAALAARWAPALDASGDAEYALATWTHLARAQRALGDAGAAATSIAHADSVWEAGRRHTRDSEYRELRGEQARLLAIESALHELAQTAAGGAGSSNAAASAASRAFDRVQRFKTRTLLERMAGPDAFADPPPAWLEAPWMGVARFQSERLQPGELLIEYLSGPDTTIAFAVTRETCEAFGLPGERTLEEALDLATDALGRAPGAAGVDPDMAARELGRRLLGPATARLAEAKRVLIAPDAHLHHVPFAALIAPGASEPLGLTHTLSIVPSATILARLRGESSPAGRGLLALIGAPLTGETPLAGAAREAEGLRKRFVNVVVWRGPGDAPSLAGFGALHFAGHSLADDQLPWRSGFVIGRAARGESLLTAADVAQRRLDARLVVLSGCRSAGTRVRSGEGVSGLASAFLIAGAPAVVATLWPVDDATTADLMAAFYEQLALGRPAAEALREAQSRLRARPATRHPFYWAGFVLVGEGGVTVPMHRRMPIWPWGYAAAAVLFAAVAWRRRSQAHLRAFGA